MYTDTNKDKIGIPIAFKSIASKVWKHFTEKGAPWSCLVTLDNHNTFFMKNTMKKTYKNALHKKNNQEKRERQN